MFNFDKPRISETKRENISFTRKYNRSNNNAIIIGGIGCGKSLAMKKMIRDDHDYHGNNMQQFIVHTSEDTYEDVMGSIGGLSIIISPENTALTINPLYYTRFDSWNTLVHKSTVNMKTNYIVNIIEIILDRSLSASEKEILSKCMSLIMRIELTKNCTLKDLYNCLLDEYDKGFDVTEILSALDELKDMWPNVWDKEDTNIGSFGECATINYRFVIDTKFRDKRIAAIEMLVLYETLLQIFVRNGYCNKYKTSVYINNIDDMLSDKIVTNTGAEVVLSYINSELMKRARQFYAGIIVSVTNIEDGTLSDEILCINNYCSYNLLLHNSDQMLALVKQLYRLSQFQIEQIDEEHVVKPGDGLWYMGENRWLPVKVNLDYHYGYVS